MQEPNQADYEDPSTGDQGVVESVSESAEEPTVSVISADVSTPTPTEPSISEPALAEPSAAEPPSVAVPHIGTSTVARQPRTSRRARQSAAVSGATAQERQDAMAKQRARGTSRMMSRPGAVSVATEGPPGEMATPSVGAVAVANVEPSPMAAAPPAAVSRATAQERQDAMAKQRARGTSRMMSRPGATSLTPAVSEAPALLNSSGTQPRAVSVVSASSSATAAVQQVESDAMAKARARGSRRTSAAPSPGAVSVQASGPIGQIAKSSQEEADSIAKSRIGDVPATQAEKDAQAKENARSAIPDQSPPSTSAPSVGGLEEIARRRETRAQVRASRRPRNHASMVGAVSVTSSEPTRESRKASSGGSSLGNSSSHGRTSRFSNMSEDERQRRYNAKMAEAGAPAPSSASTVSQTTATSSTISSGRESSVFSNMSESDREQRFRAKVGNMEQQHSDNREKRSQISSDLSHLRAEQPVTTPTLPTPITITTADRGVAVAPEVEYGEYNPAPAIDDNDLAIAIAIDEEEEEEKLYAMAVEYDPDSKPPLYQNRRFRLYGIGGTACFCILLIVLIVVISGSDKGETVLLTLPPTGAPTMSPTSARESIFLSKFGQAVGEKVLEEGTPHNLAAQWIMNEDPRQLEPTDADLLQRYILAFFYFHTTENGENKWRSCNPPDPEAGEDDTCEFLEFTRLQDDSIQFVPRQNRIRWLSGEEECRWQGVECAGGDEVLGFRLFGQELTGTLPTELTVLPFLQRISVAYNLMTGTIPREYANLRHLLDIEFHGNMLTGSIPVEFFERESQTLVNFNVGDNMITGTLDSRLGLFTDLKGLHLFENSFEGTFPTEIGNLNYLSFSRVNENNFSGPLPSELGELLQLSELWYHSNSFTGTLPSTLGRLKRLQDFRLWGNQLIGTIPDELFNMSKLRRFSVREMNLSGTLSPKVSQLTDLQQLKVSGNELVGSIPESIQTMTSLRLLWLHWNEFDGAVPLSICALNRPNGLNFFQTDCGGTDPRNECPVGCCSACCDADRICLSNSG